MRYVDLETPLGPMVAAATESAVVLLEFRHEDRIASQRHTLARFLRNEPWEPGRTEILDQLSAELNEYFLGIRRTFEVPIELYGTPFQRAVWSRLQEIAFGQTFSYGDLARDLGQPGASRAVGRANGENRLAVVVPCHRVVDARGGAHGYAGGLERKRWLLAHESGQSSFNSSCAG